MTTEMPQSNEHKQSCGSASAEGKQSCIMPSNSKCTEGNAEHAPVHSGEFDAPQTISYEQGYAIRGLAMIMIIFVHSVNEYEWYNSTLSKFALIPLFGTFGSSLFFFMSGYGIFNSLRKKGKEIKYNYLLAQIKKILIPVAVVYVINSIILPYTLTYNNISIDHSNILTLSLPEGTDIWFIKIILFDYLTTFFIFKSISNYKKQLSYIAITQIALIAILYIFKAGSYWYVSNFCFVLGVLNSNFPIFKRKILITSTFIFITTYFCFTSNIISAPIQILCNIAFCTIIIYAMSRITTYPKWLCYIGKNSLLYYLLNIPIMLLIPSENMHAIVYFIANVFITTISIILYKRVERLIKQKHKQ